MKIKMKDQDNLNLALRSCSGSGNITSSVLDVHELIIVRGILTDKSILDGASGRLATTSMRRSVGRSP
jgi:hypothetical protein